MVPMTALNGALAITVKKYMPNLGKGKNLDFGQIEQKLGLDEDDDNLDAEEEPS